MTRHKTSKRTWGDVGIGGPWKVRTKSHSCSAVTCVLLVISALWPQNNVKPYVHSTGSVKPPFGYSTGPCGCRTGLETSYDQSCGVVRGLCGAHTGPIGNIRPASPYMKLPASLQAP